MGVFCSLKGFYSLYEGIQYSFNISTQFSVHTFLSEQLIVQSISRIRTEKP